MYKLPIFLLLCFSCCDIHAQEAVLTGGGEAEGTNGQVSYSVGQVAYQNYFSNSGSSAEGVQQPYEISIVTNIEESDSPGIDLATYPNPVADYFEIQVTPWEGTNIEFRVLDSSGKLIHEGAISGEHTSIDSRQWSNGQYVVQLAAPVNQSIRVIKIQQ